MKRLKVLAALSVLALTGCAAPLSEPHTQGVRVVASTPIIADITQAVVGNRTSVTTLIPTLADTHSYEPTLRDIRSVATADLVFTNGLLLEEHKLTRAVEANLADNAQHIAVAEEAPRYGARIIPLVENFSLSTIWLGMRVEGQDGGITSTTIRAVKAEGPGHVSAFLTGTFGQPTTYIDSSDGLNHLDTVELPPDAHTHMSWAFSKPGIYRLTLQAHAHTPTEERLLGEETFTFAVGTPPPSGLTVLDHGHMDVTASTEHGLVLRGDSQSGTSVTQLYEASRSVIVIPDAALSTIPAEPAYRFLGKAGGETYLLAQAVLGKHVHGDIDPHMWLDPASGEAYVRVILEALIRKDPAGREEYEHNAATYIDKIHHARKYVEETLALIPPENRNLITTHDGFGYLANSYGLKVAGFLTPNAGIQPSTRDGIVLRRTIRTLKVPAVYIEPNSATHSGELIEAARAHGVRVCTLYSENFDENVTSYLSLLTTNAHNLATCLNPEALRPPKYQENL